MRFETLAGDATAESATAESAATESATAESATAESATAESITATPRTELRHLGLRSYRPILQRMRAFTRARQAGDADQIWLLQHHAVFTRGANCRARPCGGRIPLVQTDRGGQMTYHAPGQLIAYLLFDLKRRPRGAKALVGEIEQTLIELLADYGVAASRRRGAPGVYVGRAKIAALGLRISRGCTYHGASLNVDMDLAPYRLIDPCGERGLAVTQLRAHAATAGMGEVEAHFARHLQTRFG
ncbi:MAG: lipoyl(octanoyl) transferase LipB [Gammaproteobacteria bacterium]